MLWPSWLRRRCVSSGRHKSTRLCQLIYRRNNPKATTTIVTVGAIKSASSCRSSFSMCFCITATTTKAPFSPLFEIAARRTHRGWCSSSMGPNQGRTSVTRWSLFGHSRPLISSDKPPDLSIDLNHRQHTTQAVIVCPLQECA